MDLVFSCSEEVFKAGALKVKPTYGGGKKKKKYKNETRKTTRCKLITVDILQVEKKKLP